MIKVHNNTATREGLPSFLQGLANESLSDLSWTDPALGVQDCAWWPEVDQSLALNAGEKYEGETLTIDAANQRVIVSRNVVPMTADELAVEQARIVAEIKTNIDLLWQAAHDYEYANINGMAVGLLTLGVLQSLPKSTAIRDWSQSIWSLYYSRKSIVTETLDDALLDFSSVGPMPYSIPDLMTELGL